MAKRTGSSKKEGKPKAKKQPGAVPVEVIRHKEKRVNIPTHELRDFVKDEEHTPKTLLYSRDPSLDPQLVWKGKDEQDRQDLNVPAVPIYIQEKIHPQALIENLRDTAKPGEQEPELGLFADFNGLPEEFEKRVEFYNWTGNWQNRMILGDSLLVMASLAEKEGLKGKVQCIYMDPPYGIKFGSNWQVSTRKRDVKDGKVEDATREPEVIRAFRDTWELGIHSYLSYLRDRLVVARELLTETGSVFVQIGDENVHLVRSVMDEVFGAENTVALITFRKTGGTTGDFLAGTADFILWYAKNREHARYNQLLLDKEVGFGGADAYDLLEQTNGSIRRLSNEEKLGGSDLTKIGRVLRYQILTSPRVREARTGFFPVVFGGKSFLPTTGEWKTHRDGMNRLVAAGRIAATGTTLSYVRYLDDFPAYPLNNVWVDTQSGSGLEKVYVVQTNTRIIERCILMTSDPGDLVLDPTCGSGTTASVAEQWGRRWITCDTSRVALALARTRLMTARYPYFLLSDSEEGQRREAELTGQMIPGHATASDVRKGFVYKRVPHVTLKSIANNPDIREGMSRAEIDAAILRHAETELLYDKPYENPKKLRVTGPFTVESISPHRVIAPDVEQPRSEQAGQRDGAGARFEQMILDNLRKAGVQNTVKQERLKFDRLDPWAGRWIQGAGEYTDGEGKHRRVAVAIGPEHGTVGPQLVKEAAKEAVQGIGFDVLVVCGFAFDPHVSEETKRFGKLVVLACRMSSDLLMGEELLKKTGAGNLFMVFGEPDVRIATRKDGKFEVEIRGLDVYDPSTGQVRSSGTDDLACWFLDTDYNGESFFVRHAYFTGAGDPYERLKRALKAEINEEAWASLYTTTSRPFDRPDTGRIAVKAINHYGDEVLKVIEV